MNELINILPDDLKKNAAVALKDVQQKTTEGTLLQAMLEEVKITIQTDEDLNRSKPVVTIGLSRVVTLLFGCNLNLF